MRKITRTAVLVLAWLWAGAALAGRFPEAMTYLIYIEGQPVGECRITCEEKSHAYAFKSTSKVKHGDYTQSLECYTEYDKTTLAPLYYSYKGEKVGRKIAGAIEFADGVIKGDIEIDGDTFPSKLRPKDQIVIFENYVIEHQVVLLATLAQAKAPIVRFHLFYPSDFAQLATSALVESEIELATPKAAVACKKFRIAIENSGEFFGFFDARGQRPVYIDFPISATELFLEAAYGTKATPKYQRPPEE